jgi:hypothetical protein
MALCKDVIEGSYDGSIECLSDSAARGFAGPALSLSTLRLPLPRRDLFCGQPLNGYRRAFGEGAGFSEDYQCKLRYGELDMARHVDCHVCFSRASLPLTPSTTRLMATARGTARRSRTRIFRALS